VIGHLDLLAERGEAAATVRGDVMEWQLVDGA
jgi:hypothetical protein